ncbi:pyrroloquinoline quinone biosynthesis peptide chaperone PqqD [Microbulbifer echini]|uniref:Pyrroloquinoline quinone biosynthesis peptide chaperone PqqD n=1 Tax=Microbulbifer echini TaxID=1529067 RepID=A0ABV4NJ65_9GAMM
MREIDIPLLPRGVRLYFDKVRNTNVLLGPERTLVLDEISNAILGEVDGSNSLETISGKLSEHYGAPQDTVQRDVQEFLQGLLEKRLVDLVDGE